MDYMNHNDYKCQTTSPSSICYDNYDVLNDMPLAMAYVPWQQWQDVYDGAKGLESGTIFKELVFPFLCASPVCRNNINYGQRTSHNTNCGRRCNL